MTELTYQTGSIAEVVEQQRFAEQELERLERDYASRKRQLLEVIEQAERARRLYAAGLDVGRIRLAERVMVVNGECNSEVRREAVEDAIRDLAAGYPHLRKAYFGVKNYAHFGDQRCDFEYGYGPAHGTIVFDVRLHRVTPIDLTNEMIEACIYYLELVKDGGLDTAKAQA
jgi:hypothetical protein